MKKVLICVGTRPNFIKVTGFKKLSSKFDLEIKLLHTGQHFDHQMSKVFFGELKLDSPDIYLDAKGATQIDMMADIMVKFEKELQHYQPDVVLVPGDVNSSTACALVASRNNIKLGCITVRENTERPITIKLGNNELIELDAYKISQRMIEKLNSSKKGEIPPLWDGHATERILDVIANS
tara:strand:- start:74 stop:613 length:540 start_codon:yes stop_codon:yes gene_type:complete